MTDMFWLSRQELRDFPSWGTIVAQDKKTGDDDPVANNKPLPETTPGFESVCLLSAATFPFDFLGFDIIYKMTCCHLCVMLMLCLALWDGDGWLAVVGVGVFDCFGSR